MRYNVRGLIATKGSGISVGPGHGNTNTCWLLLCTIKLMITCTIKLIVMMHYSIIVTIFSGTTWKIIPVLTSETRNVNLDSISTASDQSNATTPLTECTCSRSASHAVKCTSLSIRTGNRSVLVVRRPSGGANSNGIIVDMVKELAKRLSADHYWLNNY